jgi:hypothetical protein
VTAVSGYENCHPLLAAVRGSTTESRVETVLKRLRVGSVLEAVRELQPLLEHIHF